MFARNKALFTLKNSRFLNFILWLTVITPLAFILHSCANVQQPTGGLKDITNPVLLSTVPKNGELNYKQRKIILNFDESIAENSIQKELIIAPYMDNTFRTTANKHQLTLEFDKELPANSTISLNFRNAVKDVHEGNFCRNLRLVFSTGNNIDTLQVKGTVNELLTKQLVTQATVALYQYSDTLDVYKHKPLYFTKSDSSGGFVLGNLKPGKYELLCYTDNNNNLLYNSKSELLSYLQETITLPLVKPDSNYVMELAPNDAMAPKRLDDAAKGWNYRVTYNENILSATYKVKENVKLIKRIDKKNLIFYSQKFIPDTLHFVVTATDSSGNSSTDTLSCVLQTKPDTTLRKKGAIYKLIGSNQLIPGKPIKFEFTDSVKAFKPEGITYRLDSGKLATAKMQWNDIRDKLSIQFPAFRKTMQVYVQKESFTLLTDSVNKKTDTLNFTLADDGNYGIINATVNPTKGPYLLQLLNDKYEIVDEVANTPTHVFKYVTPGTYFLRVIEDSNGNGLWDAGNYKKRIMPEKTRVYKDKIAIKANWEIEEIKL